MRSPNQNRGRGSREQKETVGQTVPGRELFVNISGTARNLKINGEN
jgi:hypothetical protein